MSQESLEKDVLVWIAAHTSDDAIRVQCETAKTKSRSFSGVGSFTQLEIQGGAPKSTLERSDVSPSIRSPAIPLDGGSVLFLKDGKIDTLEIYVNGSDPYPEDIQDYELFE